MATIKHGRGGPDIEGIRLAPNTLIEASDVYNSTSKTWELAGKTHEGGRVPAGEHVIWVRPDQKQAGVRRTEGTFSPEARAAADAFYAHKGASRTCPVRAAYAAPKADAVGRFLTATVWNVEEEMAKKKVLLQEWMTEEGHKMSVSFSEAQLNATIADLKARGRGKPEGKALEVELDDDDDTSYALLEMAEGDTIFLNRDEEEVIIYPE